MSPLVCSVHSRQESRNGSRKDRSKETRAKDLSPRHELENKFREPVPEI